jgi:small subunit ribosomal protein S15
VVQPVERLANLSLGGREKALHLPSIRKDVMQLTKEAKKELFKKHGGSETNTGSTEGQIALFTKRIEHLTGHLKSNKKDHATTSALLDLVGKRKQLLNYLKNNDITRYRAIISELGLRK